MRQGGGVNSESTPADTAVETGRDLEAYFAPFRRNIIGIDQSFPTPFGDRRIVYFDWTASGRLFEPIERNLVTGLGPYVGNTHTESSVTGTLMTQAYHRAHVIIKRHVKAGPDDVILTTGSGMTGVLVKFQRMLGLKVPDRLRPFVNIPDELRPVVFISHMEHHSNHTSWLETIADVECIEPDEQGLVNLDNLRSLLIKHKDRKTKIGAFTAGSNVTGIRPPIHAMAAIMHEFGGYCFVDYAAAAPYVDINMHPEDPAGRLDAIFFSPHKFLGGPGAAGVLVFDSSLYDNEVPDQPGGGTVDWTNPWGGRKYIDGIELREDGGTPAFLQSIKAALAVELKEEMGTAKIRAREDQLLAAALDGLRRISHLHVLADHLQDRLGIVSFYVEQVHYNLMVRLLNDRFGIQVRGGCSCAGTYGHYLLHVDPLQSKLITDKIDHGDLSEKPGWVRMSFHPTTTDEEMAYVVDAIGQVVRRHEEWSSDYRYDSACNEFLPTRPQTLSGQMLGRWFRSAEPDD